MLTLIEIMDKLEALLKDELGTFSNGIPAIWSEPPLPPTGKIQGLACIVQAVPRNKSLKNASGNLKFSDENWVVTLVQFDRKKTTLNALRLIQKTFKVITDINQTEATEKVYEQVTVFIWNPHFV